jgi:hypothetical protein
MRDAIRSTTLASALLLALGSAFAAHAAPFTYHGNLTDGGQPANGRYDLQVALYGSEQGATPLMPAATLFGVEVRDGSFSTELDLGEALAEQRVLDRQPRFPAALRLKLGVAAVDPPDRELGIGDEIEVV